MNGVEAKWVLQFYTQFNLIYFATLSFVYTKCVRLSWSGQQQTCMQSFRCAGDSLLGYFTYRDDGLLNHLFHSTMYFVVLLNGFVVSLHFKPFGLNYSDTNILVKVSDYTTLSHSTCVFVWGHFEQLVWVLSDSQFHILAGPISCADSLSVSLFLQGCWGPETSQCCQDFLLLSVQLWYLWK